MRSRNTELLERKEDKVKKENKKDRINRKQKQQTIV